MMKKNIILITTIIALIFSAIVNVFQYKTIIEERKTIIEERKTINNYKNYYNAAEDLLNSINNDIKIEDTYMCGEIGANYYIAVSKLTCFKKVGHKNK